MSEDTTTPIVAAEVAAPAADTPDADTGDDAIEFDRTAILEERAADRVRKMYRPENTFAEVVPLAEFYAEGVSEEDANVAHTEACSLMQDLSCSTDEARQLFAEHRSAAAASPPDEVTLTSMAAESQAALDERYGEHAPRVLADAKALIKKDPLLARLVELNGFGSRKAVVLLFAELGQRARNAGRLSRK